MRNRPILRRLKAPWATPRSNAGSRRLRNAAATGAVISVGQSGRPSSAFIILIFAIVRLRTDADTGRPDADKGPFSGAGTRGARPAAE